MGEACAGPVPVSDPDDSPSGRGVTPVRATSGGAPVPWFEALALSPLLSHELPEAELML